MSGIKVIIELKETSQEIIHLNVRNTYQKGDFYCVYCDEEGVAAGYVYKYPMTNIWRVIEDYA